MLRLVEQMPKPARLSGAKPVGVSIGENSWMRHTHEKKQLCSDQRSLKNDNSDNSSKGEKC